MKFPTKIPTLVGILLLLLIVGGSIFWVEKAFRSESKASGSREPKHIRTTNITSTSFTVSWTTELPTTGALLVTTKGKSNKTFLDERDSSGKLGKYSIHSVSVKNVTENTDFLVTPLVDGKPHILANKPIAVRTAMSLPLNTGGLEPAYGTIQAADSVVLQEALVYLSVEGGQELSVLAKPSGSWIIPLNQLRTSDLTSYLPMVERMNETIQMFSGSQETSIVTDTLNDSPVPEVLMGKEYDFRKQQAKKTQSNTLALRPVTPVVSIPPEPTSSPVPTVANVLGETTQRNYTVSLTNPKQDGTYSTTLPLIQGTGIPGKYIGITLGLTNTTVESVQVASTGLWSFTPKKPLSPGKQSVTISSVDINGKSVAITHLFTIFKSGTQVLGDATPSATIAPTIIATTTTPEVTDTPIVESTEAGNPPPTSGNELPTIILLVIAFGLIIGGSASFIGLQSHLE